MPPFWIPLFWYVAWTVGAPLANGAATERGFWEHAGTILAVCGLLVTVWMGVRRFVRWILRPIA